MVVIGLVAWLFEVLVIINDSIDDPTNILKISESFWFKLLGTIVNWIHGTVLVLWGSSFIFLWLRKENEFFYLHGLQNILKDEERINTSNYIHC